MIVARSVPQIPPRIVRSRTQRGDGNGGTSTRAGRKPDSRDQYARGVTMPASLQQAQRTGRVSKTNAVMDSGAAGSPGRVEACNRSRPAGNARLADGEVISTAES
jgi:hypothetical protein